MGKWVRKGVAVWLSVYETSYRSCSVALGGYGWQCSATKANAGPSDFLELAAGVLFSPGDNNTPAASLDP